MPDDDTDPQTAAMQEGAEIETPVDSFGAGEHHPRTRPDPSPPTDAPLTTDSEAQTDDSVIQPDTA